MNRTLVIVKPDGVERGLAGEIVGRLERKGLRLVAAELRTITAEVAGRHYAEHDGQAVLRRPGGLHHPVAGPGDGGGGPRRRDLRRGAHADGRDQPQAGGPGTIRGDLAVEMTENLVHGSDSVESAAREIALFFPGLA